MTLVQYRHIRALLTADKDILNFGFFLCSDFFITLHHKVYFTEIQLDIVLITSVWTLIGE